MVKTVDVQGFDALMKTLETSGGKDVYIFFSGSKGENGESWCPDCVVAQPVVYKCLEDLAEDVTFIYCEVGQRDYWKDQKNEFRTHDKLKLTGVPTLMKWSSRMKLVEEQCAKADLVALFFEAD